MELKTKYNINETVFFIQNGAIRNSKISDIEIKVGSCYEKKADNKRGLKRTGNLMPLLSETKYSLESFPEEIKFREKLLFTSREKLIESL